MTDENRSEIWEAIERKHFGQCVWQQRSPNGRALLEGLIHKTTGRIMVVEKMYRARLPRPNTSKPWPDLETVNIYAPVDAETMTWDGLDAALAQFGRMKEAA